MPTNYAKGHANRLKAPKAAPGSPAQVGQQSAAGHALYERQMSTVDQLQTALAAGDISQEQYDDAVGQLFDAQLQQLQRQLQAQSKAGAAAAVPVGAGVSDQPPSAGANPFTPPEGVTFAPAGGNRPQGAPPGDLGLLAGPTSRPDESVTTPAPQSGTVPDAVLQNIPALIRAAQDPDASPAVKALLRLLDHYINGVPDAR